MINSNKLTKDIANDELLDDKASSKVTGCTPSTLKQSRHTGRLYGREAPPFLKLGKRKVRYRKSTLIKWLSQFEEFPNTSAVTQ